MRNANVTAVLVLILLSVGLLFRVQQTAYALTDGPCPPTEAFNVSPCPTGSSSMAVPTGNQDCAAGDPIYANGSQYYHCCIYDLYNNYCVNNTTGAMTADGNLELNLRELGPGHCFLISNPGAPRQYQCQAY